MEDKFLTPAQIAEKLQINKRTVERWLIAGKLKGTKAGRLWRIKESDLEEFLKSEND